MRSDRASQQPKSSIRHIAIGAAISCCVIFAMACGNADSQDAMSPDGYEIVGRATSVPATATPAPVAEEVHEPVIERQINVVSAEGNYADSDFEALANFKLNKSYDVAGLESAKNAIYGFFGPDPYERQEYEARFYPDHQTAVTVGVDFANEATGPDAVIASATQRWDEGLIQRRACAANTRGSHHSGRCNIAKYGDYVVAGNLVLLCQGRDSDTALENCEALYAALQ